MDNCQFLLSNFIAHRGLHSFFKENTLSAFQLAMDKGYIIELDVHLSLDMEVVVFHDYYLDRLFHIKKKISDLSLQELKKYSIPTLDEVLKLVHGVVPIIIEIKPYHKILFQKLISLLDLYQGEFAIQSFHPLTIWYFKKNRKNYVKGLLFYDFIQNHYLFHKITKYLLIILKPNFIGINLSSLRKDIIQRLRNSYLIIGWTLKNEKDYLKYQPYADNFICDITHQFPKKQETVPLRTVSQKE